jgi:O-acetyl-ADP-ribose deacetylase (regulator of RNase III)
MIEYRKGNLLEADAEALVNTVNCVGIMGKGVALQFKKAFPENFRHYEKACHDEQVRIGQMFIVPTNSFTNPKYIINFPTKRHWKGKSRLEDIRTGLEALVNDVRYLDIRSIALPPLGCGNGGLEWSEVAPLIESAFAKLPNVQVLLFEPQGAPKAETMRIATAKPSLTRARALLIRLMELYRIPGYSLSLLEIQKLAYFLQFAGEPLKLRYVKHKYGPYADNLNHVLQALDGHYICGYGDRSRRPEITLLPEGVEEARLFLSELPEAEERLEKTRQLIEGFESPYGMELLASVLWIVEENPQAAADLSQVIISIQKWSSRKRLLFKPEHIRKAWQRLQDEKWMSTINLKTTET